MSETVTTAPESLEYRTEVKQLLDILAHSLYTDREIFLRELISNASDALNRIQYEQLTNHDVLDADRELAIHLVVDPEAKTLTIADSGIGMNRDELIQNLGTIAHSGAKAFLSSAAEGNKATVEEIIGQFGVGFYSVFMVAAEVTVTSRSYRAADQAWAWSSQGDSRFTLTPVEKPTRGTTIFIQLKEDAAEFANHWRIEQIIKKHSDYVSFPIYLQEPKPEGEGEPTAKVVNRRTALWRQAASQVKPEEYKEFYQQLTFDTADPLLHIHLVADAPVNLRSILFVPTKRDRGLFTGQSDHGLRLYSRKILIQQRNKDLLPEYFRFVEGVVDSEDLPLNVSREMVQSNPVLRQMRRALTNRLFRDLKNLAENDEEKYLTFWHEFGVFMKEGVASDPASHESLVELLRFQSSKTTEAKPWLTLKQYKERMATDQQAIYYVLGENLKSVARSPHLDYFRANNIEVLYLVDPIDGFMTSMLREYDGVALKNVDDAGLELPKNEQENKEEAKPVAQDDFERLVERFKAVLGDRVTNVRESKQLVNSPCRLVSPEDSFDRDLQRIRRLTEQDYEVPKKLLELNRRHALVANLAQILAKADTDTVVDAAIYQLFDNALLLEGISPNPADMVEHIQTLMEMAVAARAN
ncbi:MAG: molecular chaperone HtpG [Caldilineaceae bacterium]|nr:molecular chaperone HtpG [Caldilineaceae bacterium]